MIINEKKLIPKKGKCQKNTSFSANMRHRKLYSSHEHIIYYIEFLKHTLQKISERHSVCLKNKVLNFQLYDLRDQVQYATYYTFFRGVYVVLECYMYILNVTKPMISFRYLSECKYDSLDLLRNTITLIEYIFTTLFVNEQKFME